MGIMASIYLAGGSTEARLVSRYVTGVRAAGYRVTLDWASVRIREVEAAGGLVTDTLHSQEDRRKIALMETRAVREAEVFWLLFPEKTSFGSGYEFGYSEGRARLRVVSGPHRNSIFSELADVAFDTHDEALDFLVKQTFPSRRIVG